MNLDLERRVIIGWEMIAVVCLCLCLTDWSCHSGSDWTGVELSWCMGSVTGADQANVSCPKQPPPTSTTSKTIMDDDVLGAVPKSIM